MQTTFHNSPIRLAVWVLASVSLAGVLQSQTTPKKPSGQLTARGAARPTFTKEQESSFEDETKEAILVAPNYRNSGLASLRFTYNDAAELKAELERQGYKVHLVPSTEATSDGIREALTKEKTYLDGTTQGTLIFAFMGHGFQDDKGKNYLMTYGADPSNMDKEALSVDEVEDLMKASGARRKVVFIDACRSVAGTRDAEKPRSMADFKAAEGLSVLLATRPGAFSYEDPDLSHGVFTYFLLEGMRGKAAGKDGYVTFDDLQKYVVKQVSEYAEKKDEAQKPRVDMKDVGGDFLMGTAPAAKPEDVKPAAAGNSLVTSDTPVMKGLGTGQAYFVLINGTNMTLIEANTGKPYAILTEDPTQLKDQSVLAKRSLRWFGGVGPEGNTVNLVAESHGNDIFQIFGRIGKPCPGDTVCNTTPYPTLAGEAAPQAAKTNNTAGRAGDLASKIPGLGGFGRAGKNLKTSSDAVNQSGFATDPRNKFTWTALNLTSTLKDPVQASPATKKTS